MMTDRVNKVKEAIVAKDKARTIQALTELQLALKDDQESVLSVTMPAVITELHKLLIDNLGVHPRSMLLRARVPNRNRRANLFVQAMINGVNLSK